MNGHRIDRRDFLRTTALAAMTGAMRVREARAQVQVPNSAGTAPAKLKAPANACDCHMHIYDPARFPMPPSQRIAPANAAVPQYRLLQRRTGTTRVVIVQPRNYAIDNRVTVDAIKQLAPNARGVAVLHPTVTDAELKALNDAGIRGIRFSLGDPATAAVTPDMVEPLARRVADLGWHVQFNVGGEQIVALADVLRRLPTPMVFDHLANPGPAGVDHPSHAIVRSLIDRGRTWVKLSGAYSNSRVGPPYPDATRIAQAFVKAAPERLVWGSDWPHPGVVAVTDKPDDAALRLLAVWAPDEAPQPHPRADRNALRFPKASRSARGRAGACRATAGYFEEALQRALAGCRRTS
jgi:predicted TIM-barrel fold metal-dependent hydrolase